MGYLRFQLVQDFFHEQYHFHSKGPSIESHQPAGWLMAMVLQNKKQELLKRHEKTASSFTPQNSPIQSVLDLCKLFFGYHSFGALFL